MRFIVISLFPEMIGQMCEHGVLGRAIREGRIAVECINPRDFAHDRHRTVDDRPYGGGPGMLMKWQPLDDAIAEARRRAGAGCRVVYMSPQGQTLTQTRVRQQAEWFAREPSSACLILVAGRYEGIDERLIEMRIDEEWSIGDYVLSGGEWPAMVVIDAVARLCPGVLGDESSALEDSFMQGLLDCPHYTRPEEVDGRRVPAVLLSGDHQAIASWRLQQSLGRTWQRRPELIEAMQADASQWDEDKAALLADFIRSQRKTVGGKKPTGTDD